MCHDPETEETNSLSRGGRGEGIVKSEYNDNNQIMVRGKNRAEWISLATLIEAGSECAQQSWKDPSRQGCCGEECGIHALSRESAAWNAVTTLTSAIFWLVLLAGRSDKTVRVQPYSVVCATPGRLLRDGQRSPVSSICARLLVGCFADIHRQIKGVVPLEATVHFVSAACLSPCFEVLHNGQIEHVVLDLGCLAWHSS